jgi:hypothetical protein
MTLTHSSRSTRGRSRSPVSWHPAIATALAVFLSAGVASCATDPHYNPDGLAAADVARLSTICQQVMGFRPSASLRDNLWPGSPDPASSTNDYRGCMASLSRSLQDMKATAAVSQASANCRAAGRENGASDSGACVVPAFELKQGSGRAQMADVVIGAGSFVPDRVARERQACTDIGAPEGQAAFATCVRRLADVSRAREMDALYRNY